MAQVNLISHKLQDLQFFNKLEKPGQVALENSCSFSVNFTADNTKCIAKLYQCVKDKTEDVNHDFFISLELVGVFAVEGPVTDEDKKDIHVSCYQQLFPYAELAAKQTCAMGGMPNFVLLRQKMDRNNVAINRKNA
jgi:preprotein translocase subunit SecB